MESSLRPFSARIRSALPQPVFEREDHYVWCPSVVRDDHGRYHLFASSWPKTLPFMASYPLNSRVVRAVADRPEGPFVYQEDALSDRGSRYWDGRALHNPQVHRIGNRFVLFYIGTTFEGDRPRTREELSRSAQLVEAAYNRFRIGCATAPSPEGPWTRLDEPVLDIRPGRWDTTITTNPSVCVCVDGSLLMIYRSNTPRGCRLGIALAAGLGDPFERLSDEPILTGMSLEDPFIWQDRTTGIFEMIAKDLSGRVCGEFHAGVHAVSHDGVHWKAAPEPKAYSRALRYADGSIRTVGHLERPFILFDENVSPVMLYFATTVPEGAFGSIDAVNKHTWITGVPLGQ
jgi:hypothetical protein